MPPCSSRLRHVTAIRVINARRSVKFNVLFRADVLTVKHVCCISAEQVKEMINLQLLNN